MNLKNMTTEKLCELFELTENMNDENIPTVRGWIMDEIQKRNPDGFNEWLEDDLSVDSDLKKFVLKEKVEG